MIAKIAVGQVYMNEQGDELEVVDIGDDVVEFDSSEGDIVRMDLDDVAEDIQTAALVLMDERVSEEADEEE